MSQKDDSQPGSVNRSPFASPLNIADLKLRLTRKAIPFQDQVKLGRELRDLGADAAELLPLALQRWTEGALFLPTTTLIEFYRNTRDVPISLLPGRASHMVKEFT